MDLVRAETSYLHHMKQSIHRMVTSLTTCKRVPLVGTRLCSVQVVHKVACHNRMVDIPPCNGQAGYTDLYRSHMARTHPCSFRLGHTRACYSHMVAELVLDMVHSRLNQY